jgi:Ecdysteroid kinase-like family
MKLFSQIISFQYFLYTSSVDELRLERIEELIQYYYYELRDLLSRLNYDMRKFPTLHGFQMQVFKKYFYGERYMIRLE